MMNPKNEHQNQRKWWMVSSWALLDISHLPNFNHKLKLFAACCLSMSLGLVGTCSNAQHNECKRWWKWNMTELLGNSFAQCCSAWPWLPVRGTVRRRNLSCTLLRVSTQMSQCDMSQASLRHIFNKRLYVAGWSATFRITSVSVRTPYRTEIIPIRSPPFALFR